MVYVFLCASVLAFVACLIRTETVHKTKAMFRTIGLAKSTILDPALGEDAKEAASRQAAVALLKGFAWLLFNLTFAGAVATACLVAPIVAGAFTINDLIAASGNAIFITVSSAFMLLVLLVRR